jgi:hypothetical protein
MIAEFNNNFRPGAVAGNWGLTDLVTESRRCQEETFVRRKCGVGRPAHNKVYQLMARERVTIVYINSRCR